MFGEKLDTVVSQVTWTAKNGGIQPGQYQDFQVNLGQLPASGQLVFKALQTYSSGEQVNWNEVSVDKSVEPEHPAPVLTITAAAPEQGTTADQAGSSDTNSNATRDQATVAAPVARQSDGGSDSTLPVAISGGALAVSLLAALLAWRRGKPAEAVDPLATRAREDANV
jgi:uncharacterized protein